MLRTEIATNPQFPTFVRQRIAQSLDWDPGVMCLDPAAPDQGIAFSYDGEWSRFAINPAATDQLMYVDHGQMFPGHGGEKIISRISKAGSVVHADSSVHGVWHSAVGGCSTWSSSYQNSLRSAQGLDPVTFADYSAYPSQGDDSRYVGMTPDGVRPEVAYIVSEFDTGEGGISVNVWNGQALLFPATQNLSVDVNGFAGPVDFQRFPPQMAPALGGGAFLCWTRNNGTENRIILRYLAADGTLGPENNVCAGERATLTVDPEGNVHLAYVNDDETGMRYRKLLVQ
jgi:hypothetical protein